MATGRMRAGIRRGLPPRSRQGAPIVRFHTKGEMHRERPGKRAMGSAIARESPVHAAP